MRTIRLFIDAPLATGCTLALPAAVAAHAAKVLRLGVGDAVVVFNGDGHQYPAMLIADGARGLAAELHARESPLRESSLRITLLQALARGDKMDWIVQKATELGAERIVPVTTERSEVKLDPARAAKRCEHWRAIAIAACEQSGRNHLPHIEPPSRLDAWLAANPATSGTARCMLHPAEHATAGLREFAREISECVQIAVGPEGGLGAADVAALRLHGFQELVLGPRVLRTETAGLAVLAAMQALRGDF